MHASNPKTVVPCILWRLLSATSIALTLVSAIPALAQEVDGDFEGETQYLDKEGNPRDIKEPTSRDRRKVTDLFPAGKTSSKEEEQAVDDLAHYYINALTLKKNISVLAEKRKELKNKYLVPCGQKNRTVTDLHTRLNELTLTTCRKVAEDSKYPRAIRYNCILMISDLDSEEYQPGASNSMVPWPAATTALLEIARDDKQYVALRLGAVIGLKRHAGLSVAASLQPQLAEGLVGILATPIGDDSNPDGQVWLRLAAADVLDMAIEKKIPVDAAKFAAALVARIGDEQMPNWARARLAGGLGKLNGRSLPPEQVPLAARSLAGMMLAICQTSPFAVDADAEAQKETKEEAGKKGSDNKKDKPDPKKDDKPEAAANSVAAEPPSPAVQKVNSEEMMWQLSQIRAALYGKEAATSKDKAADPAIGLRAAAGDDATKTMIDKIVAHIDEIVRLLADVPDGKDASSKLADNLRETSEDLEGMLSAPAAREEEAAPAGKPVAATAVGNKPAVP
ncbi:MAG TPA: hypothetical protein VG826_18675 [Pirellulales bacterium]|nr:hypothetical protein [Pirellulales bacterium]